MSVSYLPPEVLKKSVFDLVNECRTKLTRGEVDLSDVETSVRGYCEAIANLPLEKGMAHRESLGELMDLIKKLEEELSIEKDKINKEMISLERIRKANIAYHKSDNSQNHEE